MTIRLKPELEALIQKDVERGPYQSADEFVEQAVQRGSRDPPRANGRPGTASDFLRHRAVRLAKLQECRLSPLDPALSPRCRICRVEYP